MNFPFYIAKRYLFSRKKHNTINIISFISVCGVALATMAMVCVLSVFNGFQDMVADFFTAFDPELKITVREGKVFDGRDERIEAIRGLKEIAVFSETIEENVMVDYKGKRTVAVLKGVEDNFEQLTDIDSILYGAGEFKLRDEVVDYAIMGADFSHILGTGIEFIDPLQISAPKRNTRINPANPAAAFNTGYLYSPGCIFMVKQEKYDANYILTSLDFTRRLFGYKTEVSAVELKLASGVNLKSFESKLADMLGDDFIVQDRYEQQADVFRVMEVEKLFAYVFLAFIALIASFNIIGSLSMLILDKREDVGTLRSLGADNKLITSIFLFEGWMISLTGILAGVLIGLLLCFIQSTYGVIPLGVDGGFVVGHLPVSVHFGDIVLIIATVTVTGFLSVLYPVRYLSKRLLKK